MWITLWKMGISLWMKANFRLKLSIFDPDGKYLKNPPYKIDRYGYIHLRINAQQCVGFVLAEAGVKQILTEMV